MRCVMKRQQMYEEYMYIRNKFSSVNSAEQSDFKEKKNTKYSDMNHLTQKVNFKSPAYQKEKNLENTKVDEIQLKKEGPYDEPIEIKMSRVPNSLDFKCKF